MTELLCLIAALLVGCLLTLFAIARRINLLRHEQAELTAHHAEWHLAQAKAVASLSAGRALFSDGMRMH